MPSLAHLYDLSPTEDCSAGGLNHNQSCADFNETIVNLYIASKTASLPELIEDYDRDIPFLTNRWRAYIQEGSRAQMATGDGFVFLAEREGQPVGYIAYHHTRRHGTQAELQSIYVRKEAQGAGVGAQLLHLIAARLIAEGTATMCVGFDPRNPYRRFYLKHGAVEINPSWAVWSDVSVIFVSH
jgi:GNAT superfamily N-acetyltransferase